MVKLNDLCDRALIGLAMLLGIDIDDDTEHCRPDGVYTTQQGTHYHRCYECGTIWEHRTPRTEAEHRVAHNCPDCGTEQCTRMKLAQLLHFRVKYPWRGFYQSGE